MNKTKIPRFNGRPELWVSKCGTNIIIRESKFHCHILRMNDSRPWQFVPFKEPWTFDFYDGSKYLVKKEYKLMERL